MKYASIGQRILAVRTELGLTQADLAEAAGVSKQAVSAWESDETKNLRPSHLFAIADLMRVSARWLALEQGPRFMKAATLALFAVVPTLGLLPSYFGCVLCQIARMLKHGVFSHSFGHLATIR